MATIGELRARYGAMSTEELLALEHGGALSDDEWMAILGELRSRGATATTPGKMVPTPLLPAPTRQEAPQRIVLSEIDVPISALIEFQFKWLIASIPVACAVLLLWFAIHKLFIAPQ